MLDMILLQLAGADIQIRLDAYSTLSSALKAYAELPNCHMTKEKIQALVGFIRTDLTRQNGRPVGPSETNLMLQALKLLVTIVWDKTLSVHLTDSHRSFVLDHSTRILEERKMPKAVILHYLHLLSTQEFSSRIMTTGRAVRLLEVLKDLPEHIKGNGVILERLMVYYRILEQAKSAFKSRLSCWIAQLLTALTCSVADIRKKAIGLGNRVTTVLCSSTTVATALRDMMESSGEQEDVLSSTICKRLGKMMKTVDEARQVPQVWAVVMLLLRGLQQKVNDWQRLHDWLRIIQKCFNCSDAEVRVEANTAWNKLVCVVRPYEGTKSFLTKMLIKPILVQLERPNGEKQSKGTRNSAFAAYCNLLYYALRPSTSFGHYDAIWDEYLVPTFRAPFLSSEQNSDRACRILIALFWREKIFPWKENRALDAAVVEPEELPLLDCKWIRSRTRSILELFGLLFRSSCWGPAAYPGTAFIAAAWRNFAKALGEACRKEVRTSTETSEAVTHLSRFLTRLCQKGPAAVQGAEEDFVSRFHFICKTMLSELGPMLFAEVGLSKEGHRPTIANNINLDSKARRPIVDILEAVQNLPEDFREGAYSDMVLDLLQLTSKARSSAKERVRFYKQCAQVVLRAGSCGSRRRLTCYAISKLACDDIATPAMNSSSDPTDIEDIVANVVKILELAVPFQNGQSEAWSALLKQSLLLTAGFRRSGVIVIERLTACLRNQDSTEASLCAAILVQEFSTAVHSSAFLNMRNPTPKTTGKKEAEIISSYHCVVSVLNLHLSRLYGLADCDGETALQSIVHAAVSLLQACPTEYILVYLTEMQESLALWLEDERRLMTTATRVGSLKLVQARKLCPVVIDVLGRHVNEIDPKCLDTLFAAAFRTSHKITINAMVKMWNSTYGMDKGLGYGDMLNQALTRLTPFFELELSGLETFESHESSSHTLHYLDNSEDDERGRPSEKPPASQGIDQMVQPAVNDGVQQEPFAVVDAAETRTRIKPDFKAHRRHDNSQMQYVSIISSSPAGADPESQELTTRQKEVRERQDREAALLFPDVRLTPRHKGAASKTVVEFSSRLFGGAEHDSFEVANLATPTLPSRQEVSYEEAMQFSPTPRSKQQALRLEDIDIPSSPPSVQGPVETSRQPGALVQSKCQNEVQEKNSNQEATGVGLVDDSPARSPVLSHDTEEALPERTEPFKSASPLVRQGHDQTQTGQKSSDHLLTKIADTVEDAPMTEPQTEDDLLITKASMQDLDGDITATNEHLVVGQLGRTSEQSPDVAGSQLQEVDTTPDVAMTGTRPETDGSSKTHPETTFETARNAGTPQEEQMGIYSDDDDFWSASQLSQDLGRAASSAPCPIFRLQLEPAPSPPAKRKQSPEAPQGLKRRKTAGSLGRPQEASRLSLQTSELHSSQMNDDCIEVDSPSFSQQSSRAAATVSEVSVAAQVPKRARGRPRKMQAQSEMPPPTGTGISLDKCRESESYEPALKVDVGLPTEGGSRQLLSKVSTGPDAYLSRSKDNPDRVLTATSASNRDSGPRRGSMEVKTNDRENQASPEEAVELLQKALSSLRNTSMGRSDLRAIDDLVFEIRTEAQNAAQRAMKSGT